jgi:catechol 2,3-dioxygenase-like lactoylglutathione lyase family enzyme
MLGPVVPRSAREERRQRGIRRFERRKVEMAAPPIQGILESCVYVDDLPAARGFYEDVLGLRLLAADVAMCVFAAGSCQNLQVCRRGWCEDDVAGPGGVVPGHTGDGPMHMAFHIATADYDARKAYLIARRIHWS